MSQLVKGLGIVARIDDPGESSVDALPDWHHARWTVGGRRPASWIHRGTEDTPREFHVDA